MDAIFTADMFKPAVDAIAAVVPVGITVGVSILAATWGARKGFSFIKGMMNQG